MLISYSDLGGRVRFFLLSLLNKLNVTSRLFLEVRVRVEECAGYECASKAAATPEGVDHGAHGLSFFKIRAH